MLLTVYLCTYLKICFSRDVCSLVDVWAARLVIMDKPPQLRTVRKYTIQTRVWARPLFFENLLLNNNKISVFQRQFLSIPTYLDVPRVST